MMIEQPDFDNTCFFILSFEFLSFFRASQVCWWDTRKGGGPEGTIGLDHCHIDPVYKAIWINAKTGAEFFTASTDGTVSAIKQLK